jgi:hypothetical protein
MMAAIRYRRGCGDRFLFLRLILGLLFWNFVLQEWVEVETDETRIWLLEQPDDRRRLALYVTHLEYPDDPDTIEEAVRIDTLEVVGWETVDIRAVYKETVLTSFICRPVTILFNSVPEITVFRTEELAIRG